MEIIASAIFLGISYLANYEQLFRVYGLIDFIEYNNFLILVSGLFQLIFILTTFFDWYMKHFEIREREIVRRSGLLFRRQKSVSLRQIVAVEIQQSPFDRIMKHATIILEHENGRVTKIRNVSNFAENAELIKQTITNTTKTALQHRSLQMLIKEGESLFLEFKQTLRYDIRKKTVSKDVERSAMKTIAGFMNSEGGTLIIGVDDEGVVTGLENDYDTLAKKNRDGLENHLSLLVKTMIGIKFTNYFRTKFEFFQGKEACIVMVEPSHKPAYLHNQEGKEEFFVRIGNSTQPFSMSEAEEYIKTRWKYI
jgi:membrane protein YdbS with pleckstrin-like domain